MVPFFLMVEDVEDVRLSGCPPCISRLSNSITARVNCGNDDILEHTVKGQIPISSDVGLTATTTWRSSTPPL